MASRRFAGQVRNHQLSALAAPVDVGIMLTTRSRSGAPQVLVRKVQETWSGGRSESWSIRPVDDLKLSFTTLESEHRQLSRQKRWQ